MTCVELADLLADYVSGELTVEVRERVTVHLCSCRRCVVVVEEYQITIRVTRALPKCEPLPAGLEARLRQAVGLP